LQKEWVGILINTNYVRLIKTMLNNNYKGGTVVKTTKTIMGRTVVKIMGKLWKGLLSKGIIVRILKHFCKTFAIADYKNLLCSSFYKQALKESLY